MKKSTAILDALAAYLLAVGLVMLCARIPSGKNHLLGISTVIFIGIPMWYIYRRELSWHQCGISARNPTKALLFFFIAMGGVFPVFLAGALLWQRYGACHFSWFHSIFAYCQPHAWIFLRPPSDWPLQVLIQLFLVALPEEVFFRGLMQGLFAKVFSGLVPIVLTSALFAMTHALFWWSALGWLVFFPSLIFGHLRARTDNLWSCVLFHMSCNVLMMVVKFR